MTAEYPSDDFVLQEVKQDNLFKLFENDPHWREAEEHLKAACVAAAENISAIQEKYEDCGAGDTDVRTAITDFVWQLLMNIPVFYYAAAEPELHSFYAERGMVEGMTAYQVRALAVEDAVKTVLDIRRSNRRAIASGVIP